MNATMKKFGWPATSIAELDHRVVALRPKQPTAGAVVVICKQPVRAFADVDREGFAELGRVVGAVEHMLKEAVDYERINWLMLMMVDPDVHFHVLPRYEGTRALAGVSLGDSGWPGPPALGEGVEPDAADAARMIAVLRGAWKDAPR